MRKVRFKSSVWWLRRAGIVNAGTFRVMAEPDPLVGLLLYILTVGDFSPRDHLNVNVQHTRRRVHGRRRMLRHDFRGHGVSS